MSSPGFLAVGGVEIANNARTVGYLSRGLGGPWFQTVQSQVCPDLLQEAFPLTVCTDSAALDDQLYTNPLATYAVGNTGVAPTQPTQMRWFEAGYWAFASGLANTFAVQVPSRNAVVQTVRATIDITGTAAVTNRSFMLGKGVALGTGSAGWITGGIKVDGASNWTLGFALRNPSGTGGTLGTSVTLPALQPGQYTLEVAMTAIGLTATLYAGCCDPSGVMATGCILGTVAYGYSSDTSGNWWATTGRTEVSDFASATQVVIGASLVTSQVPFDASQLVVTEVAAFVPCVQNAGADLFPADSLWPADDLYPGLYGEFHDPGTDSAPWVDTDRPEGYGYLGFLVDDITGLDTTSERSVDPAADGVGGILGPETFAARVLAVKGWLIATDCSAMEYARRWLAETLADSLCAGCDLSYVDVRTTCGDDPAGDFNTNRWRLYDCGLTGMTTDTSDQEMCCFVTPVEFQITAGDPFLYGPQVTVSGPTALNPGGADSPPVPFETWLFQQGTPICTTVADQGIGVDAPIFTFYGGTSGIEAALAYPSMGFYPSDAIWPSDCLYPADGSIQWDMSDCPFAFNFAIGPGETFVIDNSRQQLVWTLADGTVMDGAPKMLMNAGDVIEWIDTCNGASIDACVAAYATCTCDTTATVTIQTQHRER